MRYLLAIILVTIFSNGCCDCPSRYPTVEIPRGTKNPSQPRLNIVVSVESGPRWKIGDSTVADNLFDSLLHARLQQAKMKTDTPVVIINPGNTALYADVLRVMRVARRDSAKVVANMQ